MCHTMRMRGGYQSSAMVWARTRFYVLPLLALSSALSPNRDTAVFSNLYRIQPGTADFELASVIPPERYLQEIGGLSPLQVQAWVDSFPHLPKLGTLSHIAPKLAFLRHTILGDITDPSLKRELLALAPPCFFGARLEKTVAPRHAFLAWKGLPHGVDLLKPPAIFTKLLSTVGGSNSSSTPHPETKLMEFLEARSDSQFADLCTSWAVESDIGKLQNPIQFSSDEVEAFCSAFRRGLLAASRGEAQSEAHVSSGALVALLLSHGAEWRPARDRRGSPLHWSAATGQMDAARALAAAVNKAEPPLLSTHAPSTPAPLSEASAAAVSSLSPSLGPPSTPPALTPGSRPASGVSRLRDRSGATVLHWAAAGARGNHFGTGGHRPVCAWLLDDHGCDPNAATGDGNTVTTSGCV